jgi:uncharacterized caspase-like protein
MTASKRMFATFFALLTTTALTPLAARAQDAAANPRIALVIGNATYKDKALATTANDAGLVAQTLQAAGFEVVGARDLDEKSLRTAMRDFLDKAAAAGPEMQAFVYLSGRGLQYDGDNYFVPVDAQINRDADVPIDALRISDFAHALAATPGKARMIVLDAARANPYATQGPPLAPGLALVDPEPGELMAYNAAPGTLAGDEEGPYGVYGKTLAGAMRQGGVDIADVFNQVRVTVNQQTQGALVPWSASKLDGPYYVFERAADAPAPAPVPEANRPIAQLPETEAYNAALQRDTMEGYQEYLTAYPNSDQARRVRAILAARREAAFWRRSVSANSPDAYWTYLRRYPKGQHVADAHRRLTILSARFQPPPDFQPAVYDDLPPPPPDENFYESRPYYAFDDFGPPPPPPPADGYYYAEDTDWRDLPPPPPPEEIGVLPVLGIAIPLIIGAIAYHDRHHHFESGGVAAVGVRPAPPPPPAPPPLPANIKPVMPAAPVPVAGGAGAGIVKPLPPIAPVAPAGGKPPVGAPIAPGGVKPPAVAPGAKLPPVPTAPVAAPAINPPGGKPVTGAPIAPGGKPLPVPTAPVVAPPTNPPGGKPVTGAPIAPGGKPLPVPTAPVVAPPTIPPGGKPVTGAPVAPGGKPLPVPTAPVVAPPTNPSGAPIKAPVALPTPTPVAPKQNNLAPVKPPLAPVQTPPAPIVHAPVAPAAPTYHAPPVQAAPVYHAPPVAAPVYHAPPPPAAPAYRPPPVAAPVYRPPPVAAPVYRPPPVAAPVYRPPPAAAPQARAPACGRPGLPPCPK